MADCGTLAVDNVSVVVNLLAVTLSNLTSSELADDVAVLVDNKTLAVDLEARARVCLFALLLGLPSLRLADSVAVTVDNITVLVDLMALKSSSITLDELTADLSIGANDGAVLLDLARLEGSKRTFLLTATFGLRQQLCTTDNVSTVVPDLTLSVTDLANESSWVTLDNDTVD